MRRLSLAATYVHVNRSCQMIPKLDVRSCLELEPLFIRLIRLWLLQVLADSVIPHDLLPVCKPLHFIVEVTLCCWQHLSDVLPIAQF